MNLDHEQDGAVRAAGTGIFAVGFGGLLACIELKQPTSLTVLLASLAVAFGLRVLAVPPALAVLIGWPLLVYGLHLHNGFFSSWRYRKLTVEERWRLAGMERFWECSQSPGALQDAAGHTAYGTGLMAFSTTLDLVFRRDWGLGLALGTAPELITWGLRNRLQWAVVAAIVVVPLTIRMSLDRFSNWTYAACYLVPAAWVAIRQLSADRPKEH